MSTKEEIAAAQAEQNFQIEMWKIRKLIKSLQLARGLGFLLFNRYLSHKN